MEWASARLGRNRHPDLVLESRAQKLFVRLLHSVSVADIVHLLEPTSMNSVYLYNRPRRMVFRPSDGEYNVSWLINWLLTRFHKKHVFSFRAPQFHDLARGLRDFERRVCWRWALRKEGFLSSPWRKFAVNTAPRFRGVVAPELNAWFKLLRGGVADFCSRIGPTEQSFNPMVRLALSSLKRSGYVCMFSDKDGGFVLVPSESTLQPHELPPEKYSQTRTLDHTMFDIYRGIAKRVAVFENDPKLVGFLCSGLTSLEDVVSPILTNVKSHKGDGDVGFRIIHNCSRHPFRPLGHYLSHHLRVAMSSWDHVYKDTPSFLRAISRFKPSSSDVFVKCDIKEFYMSGSHSFLSSAAADMAKADGAQLVHDITYNLLRTQFVSCGQSVFAVEQGSGMGFNASDEIANCGFYVETERMTILHHDWRNTFGVRFYGRCKDDILIILRYSQGAILRFRDAFQQRSTHFKIAGWEASTVGVSFLDTFISKHQISGDNWVIRTRVHFKETALGRVLGDNSSHPGFIHVAWMKQELRRYARNSSTYDDFCWAKSVLISRLESCWIEKDIVAQVQAHDPYLANLLKISSCARSRKKHASENVRIVLPYHFTMRRLPMFLREWYNSPEMKAVLRAAWDMVLPFDQLLVSWRLASSNLGTILTSMA